MKYINLFFLLSVLAPMAVRANGVSGIGDTVVPFQRIYDAVQKQPQLYDSDFVFLLGERVADKNYTLQKVAQACIDYAAYNNAVTKDICKEFVATAFGPSDVATESGGSVTDGVILTTTNDMPAEAEIKITIYAAGQFNVDCDNGKPAHTIDNTTIKIENIKCEYDAGGVHNIKITGLATNYPPYDDEHSRQGVIYFNGSEYLESVQGSLGSIFPTLDDGKRPTFAHAFDLCTNLTTIPPDLFKGVTGAAEGMFRSTFADCTNLTEIPTGLFSNVNGAADFMFFGTFQNCTSLATIHGDLFSGVTGKADGMFRATFYGCSALTDIPDGLFSNVNGAAAEMFNVTFCGCSALTKIPNGLFDGVNAAAAKMFYGTFYGCSELTTIPDGLFDGVTGAANKMFDYTFYGVPDAVIPGDVKDKIAEYN